MSFLDFCLGCDTQTDGGAYCSQRCRLQDMESDAPAYAPSHPSYDLSSSAPRRGFTTAGAAGFHLPPAFDFSAYRTSAPTKPTARRTGSTSTASSRPTSLYAERGPSARWDAPAPYGYPPSATTLSGSSSHAYPLDPGSRHAYPLYPGSSQPYPLAAPLYSASSSQASLLSSSGSSGSSGSTGPGSAGMSRQVREELRDYTNSFDPVRDLRRRKASA